MIFFDNATIENIVMTLVFIFAGIGFSFMVFEFITILTELAFVAKL